MSFTRTNCIGLLWTNSQRCAHLNNRDIRPRMWPRVFLGAPFSEESWDESEVVLLLAGCSASARNRAPKSPVAHFLSLLMLRMCAASLGTLRRSPAASDWGWTTDVRGRLPVTDENRPCAYPLFWFSGLLLAALMAVTGLLNHITTALCARSKESHHPLRHPLPPKIPLVLVPVSYRQPGSRRRGFTLKAQLRWQFVFPTRPVRSLQTPL